MKFLIFLFILMRYTIFLFIAIFFILLDIRFVFEILICRFQTNLTMNIACCDRSNINKHEFDDLKILQQK